MTRTVVAFAAVLAIAAALSAQGDPQPTCRMCPGTYVPSAEIKSYVDKAVAERLTDQQIRDVEIGKAHVGVGVVYRGRLDSPAPTSVAEHDLVSEVYHIIDGAATLELGPDLDGKVRRPASLQTVREFNGPGNNAASIKNGVRYDLHPGDVVVIPAGTGHLFTKVPDHISYLIIRIDPDKVTPVRDEAASRAYLGQGRR